MLSAVSLSLLRLVYAMPALALALLGIWNTLALSIVERNRALGVCGRSV